jgi:hypothetical protein
LVCSPCAVRWRVVRLCHGWPGPEVLLSHLLSVDYTQNGGLG